MAAGSALPRLPARNDCRAALSSHICTISNTAISDIAPAIAVRPRVLGGRSALLDIVMTPLRPQRRFRHRDFQERLSEEAVAVDPAGPSRLRPRRTLCGKDIRAGHFLASNRPRKTSACISG